MIAWLLLLAAAAPAGESPFEAVLRAHGIEPDVAGIRAFLRSLPPEDAVLASARRWAGELGSPHAARRRQAAAALAELGPAAIPELEAAARSDDPEVARNARELLARARTLRADGTVAALRVIHARRLRGLAAEVVALPPVIGTELPGTLLEHALEATVAREDAAALLRLVDHGGNGQPALALRGYAVAAGRAAQPELRARLADARDQVRLVAALGLADLGDRACLPVFVDLLSSDDLAVRLGSVQVLRTVSGERFGYVPAADIVTRTGPTLGWGDWLGSHRDTATWPTPLPRLPPAVGRILVAQYNLNRVTEYDLAGRKVWGRDGVKAAWAPCGTLAGHRFVVQITERRIVEFDAAGEEVSAIGLLPSFPNSVRCLPNGHVLVAMHVNDGLLVEYDPAGRSVWQQKIHGCPTDAERLPDGRTLVALWEGKVVEIDHAGRILWEVGDLEGPTCVQRLASGNTLVCEKNADRVVELTPSGRIVWRFRTPARCHAAQRLPDGRTLVSAGGDVFFVDARGRVTPVLQGAGAARASFY